MNKTIILALLFVFPHLGCSGDGHSEELINKEKVKSLQGDFKLFESTELEKLALFVQNEDVKKIRKYINDHEVNLDLQESKFDYTLLALAVENLKYESVKTLLELGADLSLRNYNHFTPLLISCQTTLVTNCNDRMIKLLLENGADPNDMKDFEGEVEPGTYVRIKSTALMYACQWGCLDAVKSLIAHGANIDQYTYYEGYGAITTSIIHKNLEITKYLIVDCNAKIPDYCYIRNETDSLTIIDFLNEKKFKESSENQIYKEQIIDFIRDKSN
ncbi:MAG: ankyrin repeat domain-containing protein [Flavobacteriales bacterium]|nr:ankyrin repeat domain-containing protein [Flavobacteriales bacterium]